MKQTLIWKRAIAAYGPSPTLCKSEQWLNELKATLWSGFSSSFIFVPYFLGTSLKYSNTNSLNHRETLLQARGLENVQWMNEYLHTPSIRRNSFQHNKTVDWPPRSPDLNLMDFWLWDCLKERVHPLKTNNHSKNWRRELF